MVWQDMSLLQDQIDLFQEWADRLAEGLRDAAAALEYTGPKARAAFRRQAIELAEEYERAVKDA